VKKAFPLDHAIAIATLLNSGSYCREPQGSVFGHWSAWRTVTGRPTRTRGVAEVSSCGSAECDRRAMVRRRVLSSRWRCGWSGRSSTWRYAAYLSRWCWLAVGGCQEGGDPGPRHQLAVLRRQHPGLGSRRALLAVLSSLQGRSKRYRGPSPCLPGAVDSTLAPGPPRVSEVAQRD
jgi:hypothetical protein